MKHKGIETVTIIELEKALQQLNTGKSPDFYGLTVENNLYAGTVTINMLLSIINCIFESGTVPDCLKTGLLTPIFKIKVKKISQRITEE